MGAKRVSGSKLTEVIKPEVKLVSYMNNAVGTVFAIWHGSRYSTPVDANIIQAIYDNNSIYGIDKSIYEECIRVSNKLIDDYPEYDDYSQNELSRAKSIITAVVNLVIKSDLPPADSIQLVFEINNATAAWRNQLVRGRLPQSFWTQTSRTAELSNMDISMSPSIHKYGGDEAVDIYRNCTNVIREAYDKLQELGVPTEDIRLTPDAMTHRVYWTVSARVLRTVIPKRISWIAQSTLWTPVIEGIITNLRSIPSLNIITEGLSTPHDVTIENGVITDHRYVNENMDRLVGKDYQPVDPLYLAYSNIHLPSDTNMAMYNSMKSSYIKQWSPEILRILHWDPEHPEKVGPYDIPEGSSLDNYQVTDPEVINIYKYLHSANDIDE